MFWNLKPLAAYAVVILVAFHRSSAEFQEFRVSLMTGKTVATSYLTLEPYSSLRCVEMCYAEGQQGRCTIAAYNQSTMSCRLSMDGQQDLLHTSDDSSMVFSYQQEPLNVTIQGIGLVR